MHRDNCEEEYYTHKAFTIGEKELPGFWVGKFETTGTKDNPTILPNYISQTFHDITNQQEIAGNIITSKEYGLFESNLDSHIIKDLEWSAIAYLTNSTYGICNGAKNGCRNIYMNNSLYYNTGSSAGHAIDTNNYGMYSYVGEKFDEYGIATEELNKELISSTTGNVYGVYDMAGGTYETVMLTNNPNSKFLETMAEKYYDISEEQPKEGELYYQLSTFEYDNETWLLRGGNSEEPESTIFSYYYYDGSAQDNVGFRIIISQK